MQTIINAIQSYQPINPQEEKDRKMMLNYLDHHDDLLTRKNETAHFTSSGFIINQTHDKALFIHHKIYDAWGWTGGHVDGERDFLKVAIKEAKEETGLENFKPLSDQIMALDILPVIGHMKNGVYISAHLHLSLAYILVADENDSLFINHEEINGVKWFDLEEVSKMEDEPHITLIYNKLIERVKE